MSFNVQHTWFGVLRTLNGESPVEAVRGSAGVVAGRLTRTRLALLQDSLARIVVRWVVESTWRSSGCLCAGQLRRGRLWQRHAEECSLRFGEQTGALLEWLASGAASESGTLEETTGQSRPTVGDQLVWALAVERLSETDGGRALARAIACRSAEQGDWSLLGRTVAWAVDSANAGSDSGRWSSAVEIERWNSAANAWVLEFAAERIADEWLRFERAKWSDGRPARVAELARGQSNLLAGWLEPAVESGRLDLIRPLLRVVREAAEWGETRGAVAAASLRGAVESDIPQLLHHWNAAGRLAVRLGELTEDARNVGYFDEGYQASQFWLAGSAAVDLPAIVRRVQANERVVAESLGTIAARGEVWA